MTVSRILLHDERALAAVTEFRGAHDLAQFGGSVVQTAAQLRAEIADSEFNRHLFWAAWEGDWVVGEASVDFPLQENLDLGYAELQAEVDARSAGYSTLIWANRVPDEYLEQYGKLLTQLELDEPDEDVVGEIADYTPERIREVEARSRASGYFNIIAVSQAPDGSLAAHSEVEVRTEPGDDLAFQRNTLVFEAHLGHRLGLGLKLATHRTIAEQFPAMRRIATWNSHVNPWMIEVNERMGYRPRYREVIYQTR
ncbi:hypothetical protein [Gulosibacter sediminis]|uniref:hypothetical protein n=1 Tax=Gulosibacter sediminis TaxID=1729695 RepID=UPI0024AD3B3E|nr:hypothetical protein [Gulosibacter sediminis]